MNKLATMSIHQIVDFAKEHPEEFEKESAQYQLDTINALCEGQDNPGQCEWRLKGYLFRLNQGSAQYKDPIARLNFVVARFYNFINKNYGLKIGGYKLKSFNAKIILELQLTLDGYGNADNCPTEIFYSFYPEHKGSPAFPSPEPAQVDINHAFLMMGKEIINIMPIIFSDEELKNRIKETILEEIQNNQ